MKFVCSVCGYVYEGEKAPEECPICHAPASKFVAQSGEMNWAAEHVVGVAQGAPEDIIADLRANFEGECSEVGMYLAMARVAHREGYPEIGLYWEKAAFEEAEHAAKFAELLGEVVTDSTKKNLEMRVEAENGATAGKFDLAKRAKAANLDAIHGPCLGSILPHAILFSRALQTGGTYENIDRNRLGCSAGRRRKGCRIYRQSRL